MVTARTSARVLLTLTVVAAVFVIAGCASTGPGGRAESFFHAVYWDAANECDVRFGSLRVERIGPDGDVTVATELDLTTEVAAFTQCYHAGIQERVVRRRQSGLSVPGNLNMTPSVDVD